jgi:mRNA interferase MazF
MQRGEIWWAQLPPPRGSEPAKKRPVLIIQGDEYNQSALNTIICISITSNILLAKAPPNFLLEKGISGLDKTSVINFSQITTVDKSYFLEHITMLPKKYIEIVNFRIRQILNI